MTSFNAYYDSDCTWSRELSQPIFGVFDFCTVTLSGGTLSVTVQQGEGGAVGARWQRTGISACLRRYELTLVEFDDDFAWPETITSTGVAFCVNPEFKCPDGTCGPGVGPRPVQYRTGASVIELPGIAMPSFGGALAHSLSYGNRMNKNDDVGFGYNWFADEVPFLIHRDDGEHVDHLAHVASPHETYWFDNEGAGYETLFHRHQHMTADPGHGQFTMTDESGNTIEYHDYMQFDNPPGLLKRKTDAAEVVTSVVNYLGRNVGELQRQVGDVVDSLLYTKYGDGPQADRVSSVTLRRDRGDGFENIRRIVYGYYEEGEDFGSLGDLKTAVRQEWNGSAWIDIDTTYLRYYVEGEAGGFVHGLKFVVLPEAFIRLGDEYDPFTATDEQVSAFADYYFEYDGDQRVTKERVMGATCGQAAFGECSYAYTDSNNEDSMSVAL